MLQGLHAPAAETGIPKLAFRGGWEVRGHCPEEREQRGELDQLLPSLLVKISSLGGVGRVASTCTGVARTQEQAREGGCRGKCSVEPQFLRSATVHAGRQGGGEAGRQGGGEPATLCLHMARPMWAAQKAP